jgi:hypothetical protein
MTSSWIFSFFLQNLANSSSESLLESLMVSNLSFLHAFLALASFF